MNQTIFFTSFDKFILYLTVFLTGAAVMIIELLGTRIIGPFYGVSLYVWSALISVTLIALALGYFIGGILADKKNSVKLSHIIALAGLFTAAIPLLSSPVLSLTDTLGIRGGAFASSMILFTVPLTFLAMVGPFVITKAADSLNIVGSVSGLVYAISTVGSVISTLVLSFYLLPEFGTRSIIDALSVFLILLSIMWALQELRTNPFFTSVTFAISLMTGVLIVTSHYNHTQNNNLGFKQVFASESIYGWVRVIDEPEKNYRWMMSDGSTIGIASLLTGNGLLQYQWNINKLPVFKPDAKNALLIGLGSGHLATHFDNLGIITDSIEIDPAVAVAAKKYFNFNPRGDLIIGDARYRVRQLKKKYDFIIHDCFTGGSDPSHLLSQEMFQTLQRRLKPGGILVVNIVGFLKGDNAEGARAIARTLQHTFAYSKLYFTNTQTNFNDITFFVSDSPLEIKPGTQKDHIDWLKHHEFTFADNDGFIITDDYNPLDSLQVAKAELYRKYVIERVGKDMLIW